MENIVIKLYTDGGCSGNPGIGGWAFIIKCQQGNEATHTLGANWEPATTNNRMELSAIIYGLETLVNRGITQYEVEVISDSSYCIKAFKDNWIKGWRRNNFMKNGKPMPNRDLWLRLEEVLKKIKVKDWIWVKGHASNKLNNLCDKYAVMSYKLKTSYYKCIDEEV